MKNAIEQIMEEKVQQRRSVQETFAWDMVQLLYYVLFLILLTTNMNYNPHPYPLFKIKSLVEKTMSAGQYPLAGVSFNVTAWATGAPISW